MNDFRSRKPYYEDDTDYTTNSPSYYQALARFTEALRNLTDRMNDVEQRFEDLMIKWLDDGTLAGILEQVLLDDYATKIHVQEKISELQQIIDQVVTELNEEMTIFKNEMDRNFNDFKRDINNDFKDFRTETNNNLDKLEQTFYDSVPKNHYVSSGFNNLQEAIYGAEGGTLYVVKGTYLISKPIKIKSNTKIIAYDCTFKRNANINNMFINDSNGSKGGYGANKNIEIIGATFDGAGGSYSDQCTIVAFGHSENIKIIDCSFKNLVDWHMIEFNSVRNGLIESCDFRDYGNRLKGTEMVQIDIARGTAQFPWFGPYDNTTCHDITVRHCKFNNGVRGVGTHSSTQSYEHHRIYIYKNEFYDMSGAAVYGLDWAFTKIHSNHFYNVYRAVHLRVNGRSVHNHSILDNYMSGIDNDSDSRGIIISGKKDGLSLDGGTIKNNKVKRFGGHGIGVDYSRKWVIDGNDVTTCGKAGIIVYGSQHCTVSNNVSRGNGLIDGDYDINGASEAVKVIFANNIVDTLYTTTTCREMFGMGNIAHTQCRVGGTNSYAVNNIVSNKLVP